MQVRVNGRERESGNGESAGQGECEREKVGIERVGERKGEERMKIMKESEL